MEGNTRKGSRRPLYFWVTMFHSSQVNLTFLHKPGRVKHSAPPNTLDCDDNVIMIMGHLNASICLHYSVGTAHLLKTLNKLGCWFMKQTNVTTTAPSGLLIDIDRVRHATLQNRAAITFLLLAHGPVCEDLEGFTAA